MGNIFHSVTLDKDKCKGCINCMKRCPTEAIRVRNKKAVILSDRCIDCGECIRVCQNRAKKAVTDSISQMQDYKYNIAMPAPSFYGQFANLDDINYILTGLLELGFDYVFEVSKAAEIISDYTRQFINSNNTLKKPIISSACSAILRLISVRFPNLIENVLPALSPAELAGKMAKEEAIKRTGLKKEEIGVFFISPCPAKATTVKRPIGIEERYIDCALSANDVYLQLLPIINKINSPMPISQSGLIGISWAQSGGESSALLFEKYLAADGIENCIKVLEEIENDRLNHVDFIELNACIGGCVGGVLNIENPFVAKARINTLRKFMPVSLNRADKKSMDIYSWKDKLEYVPVLQLDSELKTAMELMKKIEDFEKTLPGYDCGTCGSPSCRAFAEDVILGYSWGNECVLKKNKN